MAADPKDLCTLEEVTAIVPGYVSDTATDAVLQRFITSESALIPAEAGREVIGPMTDPDPPSNPSLPDVVARTFPIDERCYLHGRRIDIGDLREIDETDTVVEVLNTAGTSILTIDHADIIPVYGSPPTREYARDTWEPITALKFRPGVTLGYRTTLKVTGTWGFPAVPPYVREACAKRVILRYVSDVASVGTSLADSIDNLNLAAMFASARDAIDQLRGAPVMLR